VTFKVTNIKLQKDSGDMIELNYIITEK